MNKTHMYKFMSEDYQNGWADGYEAHQMNQQYPVELMRTEAFGAIRRAAEVMREYEALGWRASQHGPRVNDLSALVAEGAIRRAIRAAIGSPKT